MKILSFVNQKGGAGKSTLAINVAVAAERAGEKVCVVDLDPQGTCANWYDIRTSETPVVIVPEVIHLKITDLLDQLKDENFSILVIDTKGEDTHGTRGAMAAADLCLVPLRPSGPDLHAARATIETLSGMGKTFGLILNQAATNKKSKLTASLMTALAHDGMVVPTAVPTRISFSKAYSFGQAAVEFEPEGGPGGVEIAEVWAWCRKHLFAAEGVRRVG